MSRAAAARTAPGAPCIESEWIGRIAEGDSDAFERLHEVYAPRVFCFTFRIVRDEMTAEEVTSDVMLEIWKSASRFAGRSAVSTWILGIARHRALNAVRGKRIETTALHDAANVCDPSPGADALSARRKLRAHLCRAMARLPREQREALELAFFEDMSSREIAGIVGCPASTVRTRLLHARRKLRPVLGDMGLDAGAA